MQEIDNRKIAEQIFLAGIDSVLPDKLISGSMKIQNNLLQIGDLTFDLTITDKIYVVGAGKASALMGAAVEKILGDQITDGIIVVKHGHAVKLRNIRIIEAGHPVPDYNGFKATSEILKISEKAGENDLVICLISGGGSSLLADFPGGSSIKELIQINDLLIKSGAGIQEINAVRKHISHVKGGQLARTGSPATLVTLILSDVPGDALDVIASGPTVPDTTTFSQALDVLKQFDLLQTVPGRLLKYLNDGVAGLHPETPKPGDPIFNKTHNLLIGTNKIALEAARNKAMEFNLNSVIIDDKIQGDIASVAEYLIKTALDFQSDKDEVKPLAILFGGEATVKMTGKGSGGRNQHLAMLCAELIKDCHGITFLSAGTDGNDGPTDAAGAVVDTNTITEAFAKSLNIAKYLSDFDSYSFFRKAGGHIITGPTKTNVMDIIVIIVEE
jgi:glycerate 2-kinase